MLASERRVRILERVAEDQSIAVSDLARLLEVSEMTIRRDIARLERDGFIRKSYGGASAHLTRSLELAISARALQHAREKRLIGLETSRLIAGSTSLFVGIGSTCEQLARYLPARPEITVVTSSLPIASLLGTRSLRVQVLGGPVRRDELSVVGPLATIGIARHRFDAAVIGTAGISARWGVTDLDPDDAEVNRTAAAHAATTIVIADGTKVGSAGPCVVAPATAATILVTDESAPPAELEALRALGVEVRVAARPLPDDGRRPDRETSADSATRARGGRTRAVRTHP